MTKTPKRSSDLANGETSEGEPTQPTSGEGVHGVVAGGLNGGILSSLEILVLRGAYGAPLRQLPFLPFSRYARFSIWASSCLCSSPTICGSASPAPTSPSRSL